MARENFDLLKSLLNNKITDSSIFFKNLFDFIDNKMFNDLKNISVSNFSSLFDNFKREVDKLYLNISYTQIFEKKLIVFGGAFSSGKSSFINYFINETILPFDINPATAVPTYIMKNNKFDSFGINIFDNKFDIELDSLKIISHGFENSNNENLKISQLIKNLIIKMPLFPYDYLAFLDTPGYTKKDSIDIFNTDEQKAKFYYNSCDYLIWFIPAPIGTITEEDLKILKELNNNVKIAIIINKADQVSMEDLNLIKEKLKLDLYNNALIVSDIFSFSKRNPEDFDSKKIHSFFTKINKTNLKNETFNMFLFFDQLEETLNKLIFNENKYLFRVNNTLTFIDDQRAINNLTILKEDINEKIKNLNKQKELLKKHRKTFLFELKILLEKLNLKNILLIEKTEINLNRFSKELFDYKFKNGIKNNFDVEIELIKFHKNIKIDYFSEIIEKSFFDIEAELKTYINNINIESINFCFANYSNQVKKIFLTN